MFQMHAADRNPIDVAEAGDIVACIGIKDAITGDTLCDPANIRSSWKSRPSPSRSSACRSSPRRPPTSRSSAKRSPCSSARTRPSRPSTTKKPARPSSPAWASCTWKSCACSLTRDHKVEVIVGKPKVAYKETITKTADGIRGKHVKQSGGRGQFGDCTISIEPFNGLGPMASRWMPKTLKKLGWEDNFAFENKIFGGTIPKEFIPSVEYGVRMAAKTGVLANYPLINAKITLTDGSYHPVDCSARSPSSWPGRSPSRKPAAKAGVDAA